MTSASQSIAQNIERGIALAGHLLQLAQPAAMTRFTDMVAEHVEIAVGVLRDSIPAGWRIECRVHNRVPTVALSGTQIEQVILNLALLVVDHSAKPSALTVELGMPEPTGLLAVENDFAGVVIVSAFDYSGVVKDSRVTISKFTGESGVIQSVIRSMLEETGGRIDCLQSEDGAPIFRVCLPFGIVTSGAGETGELSDELKAYISNLSVLVGKSGREAMLVEKRLHQLGVKVVSHDSISAILAAIEESVNMDAMILDARLMGREIAPLLKAILKLRPSSGVVVLCEDPENMPRGLSADIVFESFKSSADKVLLSVLESKSLSAKRKK
jgi:hypothetical protein